MPHSLLSLFRTKGFPIASIGIVFGVVTSEDAAAAEIKIFTTRSISIPAPDDVSVAYLDDAGAIETRLSASLPEQPLRFVDAFFPNFEAGRAS